MSDFVLLKKVKCDRLWRGFAHRTLSTRLPPPGALRAIAYGGRVRDR
ncbi:hypothetical protein [Anabaena sp. CCY 0017]